MLENVTIIIKTFERKKCLEKLLDSIEKMTFPCPVLIADDSELPYKDDIEQKYGSLVTDYIILPFDSGLSKGRNALVDQVKTDYFLLCDDDFVFDQRTDLIFMMNILENTEVDLLGGVLYDLLPSNEPSSPLSTRRKLLQLLRRRAKKERIRKYQGVYQVVNGICFVKPINYKPPYTRCDCVLNFFMAKTASFHEKGIRWDDNLKIGEHTDFFYTIFKNKSLVVATTEKVGISHQPIITDKYKQYRFKRIGDKQDYILQKHSLNKFDYQLYTTRTKFWSRISSIWPRF